jgi:uncharacterized protein YbcI
VDERYSKNKGEVCDINRLVILINFYNNILCTVYSLSGVIERKRILAEAQGRVLLSRRRIELMKQAYEDNKGLLHEGKNNCVINQIVVLSPTSLT